MSENKAASNSFPFASILTLIFITLKLLGKITWSWWWVLSPAWISLALVVLLFAVAFVALYLKEQKK